MLCPCQTGLQSAKRTTNPTSKWILRENTLTKISLPIRRQTKREFILPPTNSPQRFHLEGVSLFRHPAGPSLLSRVFHGTFQWLKRQSGEYHGPQDYQTGGERRKARPWSPRGYVDIYHFPAFFRVQLLDRSCSFWINCWYWALKAIMLSLSKQFLFFYFYVWR